MANSRPTAETSELLQEESKEESKNAVFVDIPLTPKFNSRQTSGSKKSIAIASNAITVTEKACSIWRFLPNCSISGNVYGGLIMGTATGTIMNFVGVVSDSWCVPLLVKIGLQGAVAIGLGRGLCDFEKEEYALGLTSMATTAVVEGLGYVLPIWQPLIGGVGLGIAAKAGEGFYDLLQCCGQSLWERANRRATAATELLEAGESSRLLPPTIK